MAIVACRRCLVRVAVSTLCQKILFLRALTGHQRGWPNFSKPTSSPCTPFFWFVNSKVTYVTRGRSSSAQVTWLRRWSWMSRCTSYKRKGEASSLSMQVYDLIPRSHLLMTKSWSEWIPVSCMIVIPKMNWRPCLKVYMPSRNLPPLEPCLDIIGSP